MSSKKSTRNRSHSRKRSKSRGRASSKGGSTRKRSTSRGKGKLKKSIVRRHYRGGADNVSKLTQPINGNVDIVVAQDTFLIVSNYDDNSICYYSIEDDPNNDKKTNYVFKTHLSKPGEGVVSNVAVQEVKDKNSGKVRTFLFYFVDASLVCLEVNLKHDRELIVYKNDNLFEAYAKKGANLTDVSNKPKYIVFYKNPDTNTHNLCYTTLVNGVLKFSEIALLLNPSKFEIYSISRPRALGKSDQLYSFCFISNGLMAFLISNKDSNIDLPEINMDDLNKYTNNSDKNKYTSITKEDMYFIKLRNTRYFTSQTTYKLMYYQYNLNTGSNSLLGGAKTSFIAFDPMYVRYSEIQGTDSRTQVSRGMVYNDNNIYINFNNTISKFRIPPECIFNHYLTMKKLGNRIETSGWKDFALHFDDRITFVQKLKDYNSKKNIESKDDNKYKQAVRDSVALSIEKNQDTEKNTKIDELYNEIKKKKDMEKEKKKQKDADEKKKADDQKEKERVQRDQEAKERSETLRKNEESAVAFKPKGWFTRGGDDRDPEILDEAGKAYEKQSTPLFGKKKTTDDLIKAYELSSIEIRIEELKEQANEGMKLKNDPNAQSDLASKIMNRYQDMQMDGKVDYNEEDYKKYATKHENDQIQNYDYDFLYFDRTDIGIKGAVGLTLYEGNLLTVTNTNTITAVIF